MATITVLTTADLDVVNKQRELTTEALGPDGVYIRLKETLIDLMDKGEIKSTDRANVVSTTLANLAGQITSGAMQTALAWASKEKELELKKCEMEYQLELLRQQGILAENQVIDSLAGRQLKQAQRIREYGIATTDSNGNVTSLANNGKVYQEELNVVQDTANKALLPSQIAAQTEELYARTHKTVADTYVNHGIYTWTSITDKGVTGVVKAATGYTTLSELQKHVAAQQAKGYSYNAWSNAATGASGMIGTLVAAEIPDLDPSAYLSLWQTAMGKLNGITEPTITI
jgi:hypothetical protein